MGGGVSVSVSVSQRAAIYVETTKKGVSFIHIRTDNELLLPRQSRLFFFRRNAHKDHPGLLSSPSKLQISEIIKPSPCFAKHDLFVFFFDELSLVLGIVQVFVVVVVLALSQLCHRFALPGTGTGHQWLIEGRNLKLSL